jgi:hypothetical protein
VKVFQVIKDLIEDKIFAMNGNVVVQDDTAILVAEKHGIRLVIEDQGSDFACGQWLDTRVSVRILNSPFAGYSTHPRLDQDLRNRRPI